MAERIELNNEPITGTVRELSGLRIIRVNNSPWEETWDYMVREYHYLGYQKMIGPRIKYLVFTEDRPIAALSYNQASLNLSVREEYVGWDTGEKKRLLPHLVNNNRFLILPWVKVKNLASHLLSVTLTMLKNDWFTLYGLIPYMVETFVDLNRNKGICYRAANWVYLGQTKGYTKVGKAFVYHGNPKGVYIYVLDKNFIQLIEQYRASRSRTLKTVDREKLIMMLQTPDWNPSIIKEAGITPDNVSKIADFLMEYTLLYKECFGREKQFVHAACYIKGLLSDLERKSIEPIALRYAESEKEVRNMQYFTQQGSWDDGQMLVVYQKQLSDTIADTKAEPDAMLTIDGSCIPKKGNESVGVARQYCGCLGKVDNCQEGVFIGYTGDKGYGLINTRLYMPEKWFGSDYKERRKKCGVPEDLEFKTKPVIAAEMLQETISSGLFPARWVGVDSGYSDQSFLDSLPEGMFYFADIHKNVTFFTSMPEVAVPPYKGKGRIPTLPVPSFSPVSAESIATDPQLEWKKTFLGEGAKGPIYSDTACIRVIGNRNGLPGKEIWLYMRRLSDGSLKYTISNAPADTPKSTFDTQAIKRWPIEQCFEECKSQLGMDHCESRSWNSWHRHMFLVFVAFLFVLRLRMQFKADKPILTFAQAQRLTVAALTGAKSVILDAIKLVTYYLRRNYFAYLSHKKRVLAFLSVP